MAKKKSSKGKKKKPASFALMWARAKAKILKMDWDADREFLWKVTQLSPQAQDIVRLFEGPNEKKKVHVNDFNDKLWGDPQDDYDRTKTALASAYKQFKKHEIDWVVYREGEMIIREDFSNDDWEYDQEVMGK